MVRIVVMGTPEFTVPPLEHLLLNGYQVAAVYTRPDRPTGRGLTSAPSPVKRLAQGCGLPVMQPDSFKDPEAVAELAAFRPDAIVVAAFGQILPKPVLELPRYGCLNIHPSLLPRFRGASPVAATILAGDEFTGVTIMLMDEGLDTGPVLAQAQIPGSPQDTTATLADRLSLVAAHLLQETLTSWVRGELTPRPQDESRASYCTPISKGAGVIDWRLSAVEIWRRVRAFNPWPGCHAMWQGRRLKLLMAAPLETGVAGEPGQVIALPEGEAEAAFGVVTSEGVLGVIQVQLEGKRVMSAREFIRGQRGFIGSKL